MKYSKYFRWLLPILLANIYLIAGASAGWFGIFLNVSGSGVFWNPTVDSITITEIIPDSPAAIGHLTTGDVILEIEGNPVVGAKASFLRSKMKREVGETLHLKLQRKNGETYLATLIAAKKP